MDSKIREKIKQNLKNSLSKYVSNFSYKTIQPLDYLIPEERKIRSVVGGLETSMGTTVWEPIANTLAEINGFKIIKENFLKPDPLPEQLANELASLVRLRENKLTWISTTECIKKLREICQELDKTEIKYVPPAPGTGVDIHFEKYGKEYAFDTKTVQPNLGSIKSFNKELLEWYAYSLCKNPNLDIQCQIAYPYNPYKDIFWSHSPHNSGVLEPRIDAVVEDEFWDFLSGVSKTYTEIVEIFKELNNQGFGRKLSKLIKKIHN